MFTQFSCSVMSDALQPHELQHVRPLCPSPTPRVYPNPRSSSRWCHPAISSSAVPFSCPQSFPALGSFPMSQLFAWGGQSLGVSASTSVLPMNTQDWSPLGWTGWIFLQSKGLSRVFSNTTVQKYQLGSLMFTRLVLNQKLYNLANSMHFQTLTFLRLSTSRPQNLPVRWKHCRACTCFICHITAHRGKPSHHHAT